MSEDILQARTYAIEAFEQSILLTDGSLMMVCGERIKKTDANEAVTIMRTGHIIQAIKHIRDIYHFGLKEAKDICEELRRQAGI